MGAGGRQGAPDGFQQSLAHAVERGKNPGPAAPFEDGEPRDPAHAADGGDSPHGQVRLVIERPRIPESLGVVQAHTIHAHAVAVSGFESPAVEGEAGPAADRDRAAGRFDFLHPKQNPLGPSAALNRAVHPAVQRHPARSQVLRQKLELGFPLRLERMQAEPNRKGGHAGPGGPPFLGIAKKVEKGRAGQGAPRGRQRQGGPGGQDHNPRYQADGRMEERSDHFFRQSCAQFRSYIIPVMIKQRIRLSPGGAPSRREGRSVDGSGCLPSLSHITLLF